MRTRVTAALIAVLAVLAWVAPSALATSATRHESGAAPPPHLAGINKTAVIIFGIVVLVVVVIFVTTRTKRRGGSRRGAGPGAPPDHGPTPGPSTEELAVQAANTLVDTDDAIRTSEQELGFATARFGEQAAASFSAALASARAELSAAFTLRQMLDDDIPDDAATTRSYLTDIGAHCAAASRLLDEQSEAFDRLQDLEASAPQLLAEVDAHVVQQSARVSESRQILDHLVAKYTPDAVVAVMSSPDQAAERLEFAAAGLASARQELADGQPGAAAVLLQAAESGADQATDLLNSVEHMQAALTQAASALPGALRELDAELAEATALLADRPQDGRTTLVARAQAIAADVRGKQAAGVLDTLAALRDVQQADAGLDHALAGVRMEQTRRERARAVLDQAMLVARSSVTAARDFIATRHGCVGATARTRLAEAQRHFRQVISAAQHDPEVALTEAQHADALAQQARALAEQDVAGFDYSQAAGPGRGGAILGGILIDAHDGEPGTGDIRPGSFGGVGTRGRRGAAGRC